MLKNIIGLIFFIGGFAILLHVFKQKTKKMDEKMDEALLQDDKSFSQKFDSFILTFLMLFTVDTLAIIHFGVKIIYNLFLLK